MKKILLSVAVLSMAFTACKKDEATSTTPTTTAAATGTMQATVDGVVINTMSLGTSATFTGNAYVISGVTTNSKLFGITLRVASKDVALGTYSIKADALANLGDAVAYYNANTSTGTADYYGTNSTNTGTLTITKYDGTAKKMSGTFSFKGIKTGGTETKTISAGSFTDIKTQ